jgi:hypothetical protein
VARQSIAPRFIPQYPAASPDDAATYAQWRTQVGGAKGMNTLSPTVALPEGQVRLARNLRCRQNRWKSRPGTASIGSNTAGGILQAVAFVTPDHQEYLIRWTQTGVDIGAGGMWTACTGPVLTAERYNPLRGPAGGRP